MAVVLETLHWGFRRVRGQLPTVLFGELVEARVGLSFLLLVTGSGQTFFFWQVLFIAFWARPPTHLPFLSDQPLNTLWLLSVLMFRFLCFFLHRYNRASSPEYILNAWA